MTSPRQIGLFDDSEPDARPVAAVAAEPGLRQLAAALPQGLRLGTSSWAFPGWAGLVYERRVDRTALAREGLRAYAEHPLLRAVGLDRSFYAPLSARVLADYAAVVPADFRFLVKAAADCVTPWVRGPGGRPAGPNDRYLQPAYAIDAVVTPYVEGLGEQGGVLVFQFPPQGRAITGRPVDFAKRLQRFLAALPSGPCYAVELRDASLLTEAYLDALAETGATHSISLHPRMPSLAIQAEAVRRLPPRPLVVRWLLHSGRGYAEARRLYDPFDRLVEPDPLTREALAALCLETSRAGWAAQVIANNKAEGSAPLTLRHLAERIAARG